MTSQAAARVFRTSGEGSLLQSIEPLPPLASEEVRVDFAAASLNFRDGYFIRGNSFRAANRGRIPLSDAVGRIASVGSSVSGLRVGDRVSPVILPQWLDGPLSADKLAGSLGSAARDGVLRSSGDFSEVEVVPVPDYLTDVEAASLPTAALTAWHALGGVPALRDGGTVVIQTTGGVALFALQFAHALGARTIVVSRSAEKLARAVRLGATNIVNTVEEPDWDRRVLELTDHVGADLVIDMGLTDGLRSSVRAAAYEATVAVVGVVQEHTNPLDIFPVMNKNLTVRGVETGSRAMFVDMLAFLEQHRIAPVIDSVFHVDDIDSALDRLEESPFGKVALTL